MPKFNGKYCFLSRALASKENREGWGRSSLNRGQTAVRWGWGPLDKQDPEKLISFSPDQHLNIAWEESCGSLREKSQFLGMCAYGASLLSPLSRPDWGQN